MNHFQGGVFHFRQKKDHLVWKRSADQPFILMKNKSLSVYKKKKLIESFCDELTATQAAHRLNLDRNTVNKYFKRIRECIAGYREYQKMHLLINLMKEPSGKVPVVHKYFASSHPQEEGIPVNIILAGGQLLTDVDIPSNIEGPAMMLNVSDFVRNQMNGHVTDEQIPQGASQAETVAEEFHDFATQRFKKYFGIRSEFAYLYMKEAEFVFNEKDGQRREKLLNGMMEQIFG